jgi:antitoxin HigA-1
MKSQGDKPFHPGMVIKHIYLLPHKISEQELAKALAMPYKFVNELLCGERSITPDIAFRLARFFNTTADFWTALQTHVDICHETLESAKQRYDQIKKTA